MHHRKEDGAMVANTGVDVINSTVVGEVVVGLRISEDDTSVTTIRRNGISYRRRSRRRSPKNSRKIETL